MKTTVVPAQITTVEDRIAGSLTFTQLIMLVTPLIIGATIYVLLPPRSHFNLIKLVLIAIQFLVFGVLAIRVRGKILIDWLVILLRFRFRPRIYIFTKNDQTSRENLEMNTVQENNKIAQKRSITKKTQTKNISIEDQLKIDKLFGNPSLNFRFGLGKKGGINVSVVASED